MRGRDGRHVMGPYRRFKVSTPVHWSLAGDNRSGRIMLDSSDFRPHERLNFACLRIFSCIFDHLPENILCILPKSEDVRPRAK